MYPPFDLRFMVATTTLVNIAILWLTVAWNTMVGTLAIDFDSVVGWALELQVAPADADYESFCDVLSGFYAPPSVNISGLWMEASITRATGEDYAWLESSAEYTNGALNSTAQSMWFYDADNDNLSGLGDNAAWWWSLLVFSHSGGGDYLGITTGLSCDSVGHIAEYYPIQTDWVPYDLVDTPIAREVGWHRLWITWAGRVATFGIDASTYGVIDFADGWLTSEDYDNTTILAKLHIDGFDTAPYTSPPHTYTAAVGFDAFEDGRSQRPIQPVTLASLDCSMMMAWLIRTEAIVWPVLRT
jgi:hypothetical protein